MWCFFQRHDDDKSWVQLNEQSRIQRFPVVASRETVGRTRMDCRNDTFLFWGVAFVNLWFLFQLRCHGLVTRS